MKIRERCVRFGGPKPGRPGSKSYFLRIRDVNGVTAKLESLTTRGRATTRVMSFVGEKKSISSVKGAISSSPRPKLRFKVDIGYTTIALLARLPSTGAARFAGSVETRSSNLYK